MISLRPYQQDAIKRVYQAFKAGAKRVCLVMPTGAGKTYTGGAIVSASLDKGHAWLWLAHRAELVDQAAASLNALGIPTNTISASAQSAPNPTATVHVATVQTLLSRNIRPRVDRIVLDECHHYAADMFGSVAKDYDRALTLGLTATPQRGDGKGLDDLFDSLVVGARIAPLVELGALVHAEIIRPARRLSRGQLAKSPVDAYRSHASGQKAIVFAGGVAQAQQFVGEFTDAGIPAALVWGEMDPSLRALTLAAFKRGDVRVLCNVYVLTEGFDVPDASCAILARNVGALGVYLQMVGRVLRPADGKREALIIDLHGCTHELGHPEDSIEYTLSGNGMTPSKADENSYCTVCGAIKEPGQPCEECGYEREGTPTTITNDPLVKYAAKRAETEEQQFATLERWAAIGRENGYKAGWLFFKARTVYGRANWRQCEQLMRR